MIMILLAAALVAYVILLILRRRNKDNKVIAGTVQIVQGILWTLIVIDGWSESHMFTRIACIIIAVLSFAAGIGTFLKRK